MADTAPPDWHKWFVLASVVTLFASLVKGLYTPEILAFVTVLVLWNAGVITDRDAMSGFSNSGLLTVGVLFVVVQGVERSQVAERAARHIFGMQTSVRSGLLRVCLFCFVCSAFLNNTPVVAMLAPITRDWARTRGFSPSTFLIPVSFSAIFGGVLTIVGTSTNLVIQGLAKAEGLKELDFFELGAVTLPAGIVGIMYLVLFAPVLLPKSTGLFRYIVNRGSELITEVEVLEEFGNKGKTAVYVIGMLGLHLDTLVKIRRPLKGLSGVESDGSFSDIFPVSPQEVIEEGDILFMSGGKKTIMSLHRSAVNSKGLRVLGGGAAELESNGTEFVEVVLGLRNPFVGDKVSTTSFGQFYGCSILALRRKGRVAPEAFTSDPQVQQMNNTNSNAAGVKGYTSLHSNDRAPPGPPQGAWVGRNPPQPPRPPAFPGNWAGPAGPYPSQATMFFGNPFSTQPISPHNFPQMDEAWARTKQDKPASVADRAAASASEESRKSPGSSEDSQDSDSDAKDIEVRDSKLNPGDALLLLVPPEWSDKYKASEDFIIIQTVGKALPPIRPYDYVPFVIFVAMIVVVVVVEEINMLRAAMLAAGFMVLGMWVDAKKAVTYIRWDLLLLIGSMLGVSTAMSRSGLADYIGTAIKDAGVEGLGGLFLFFIVPSLMTEIVTNNAAAALVFPIAVSFATKLGISYKPFMVMIMTGASCSFLTPIGYQTNMMVWAPGGYKFFDFTKIGFGLNIIYMLVVVLLAPAVWPLNDPNYIIPSE